MSLLEEVQNDIRHTSRMTAQIILSRSKMRWIVDHCLRKIEKDEIKINPERDVQLFHVFHPLSTGEICTLYCWNTHTILVFRVVSFNGIVNTFVGGNFNLTFPPGWTLFYFKRSDISLDVTWLTFW